MSDVTDALDPDECTELIRLEEKINLARERRGKGALEGVVIEHDWPEFEPVWDMLSKRVDDSELPEWFCSGSGKPPIEGCEYFHGTCGCNKEETCEHHVPF